MYVKPMGEVLELDVESLEALDLQSVCHDDLRAFGFTRPAQDDTGASSGIGVFRGLLIGLPVAIALWALLFAIPAALYFLIA